MNILSTTLVNTQTNLLRVPIQLNQEAECAQKCTLLVEKCLEEKDEDEEELCYEMEDECNEKCK